MPHGFHHEKWVETHIVHLLQPKIKQIRVQIVWAPLNYTQTVALLDSQGPQLGARKQAEGIREREAAFYIPSPATTETRNNRNRVAA